MKHSEAIEQWEYDPETGDLHHKGNWPNSGEGSIAGTIHRTGYRVVSYKGAKYLAHRIVWLIIYGEFPEYEIDHIDRDKTNNKIENLRDVTHLTNMRNRRK